MRQDVADAFVVRGRNVDGLADAHAVDVTSVERRDAAFALVREQQRGAVLLIQPPCKLNVKRCDATSSVDQEQHKIRMPDAEFSLRQRLDQRQVQSLNSLRLAPRTSTFDSK